MKCTTILTTLCILISSCENAVNGPHVGPDQVFTETNEGFSGSDRKNFNCILTIDNNRLDPGELPEISVRIVNNSTDSVMLIGSLDGSDVQMRMPYCYFTLVRPSLSLPRDTYRRCGNVNPLRSEDFILVAPNQSFDPYSDIDDMGFFGNELISSEESFSRSGHYTIQFHYSTLSADIDDFSPQFYEDDSLELIELFSRVPKIELHSNIVEFYVE